MERKRTTLNRAATRLTLIVAAAALVALAQQVVLEPLVFSEVVQAHGDGPRPETEARP